jgi:Glycoside-hydrolase family GH114
VKRSRLGFVVAVLAAGVVVGLTATSAGGAPGAGQVTASHKVRLPPANGRFDYQIGGAYKPLASVRIVDRDRTSKPAPGVYNICYINAFQTQAYQDGWWKRHHPKLLLRNAKGTPIEDPGWPGEIILNTSTAADRKALGTIEDNWLRGCKSKGFNAVEPDNLDSNTRSHGRLTQAEDFAFAKLLVSDAHADGLAIAQKNDAEQSAHLRKTVHFDFAIAEECQVFSECSFYQKAYGDEVYEIEYTDNGRAAYSKACAKRGASISIILRDRNVVPRGAKGYFYEAC